jgi:hypothetical protein
MTWSRFSSACGNTLPQYWQRLRSRKEDVAPSEAHLAPRNAIVVEQLDDAGNPDLAARRDDLLVVGARREVAPVLEVVGAKVGRHGAGAARVEQTERADARS